MTVQSLTSTSISRKTLILSKRNVAFFATIHALALLAPWYFSWSALGVTPAVLLWLKGSSIPGQVPTKPPEISVARVIAVK